MEEGYIRSFCPECGNKLRVLVKFPNFDSKFIDTKINCNHCEAELLITDTHYDN